MSLLSEMGINAGGGGSVSLITASKTLSSSDSGFVFENRTVTNIVLTLPIGLPSTFNVAAAQRSTGTIQIIGDTGVTLIGNANITALQGQYVYAAYSGVNTFDVKAG